jgi:hypothetical protein
MEEAGWIVFHYSFRRLGTILFLFACKKGCGNRIFRQDSRD